MNKSEIVKDNEWKALYQAADEFFKLRCWEWIYDSDIFGVKNPETGETGYCCIMGNLGEVFALNVYLGSYGLLSYKNIYESALLAEQGATIDYHKILTSQRCLIASFEDRAKLEKRDMEVINKLCLKFRGRDSWPLFRSYKTAYVPWFIISPEARFLTIALQQANEMALMLKEDQTLLDAPVAGDYLVRVFEKGRWENVWLSPDPIPETTLFPEIDEIAIARLKKAKLSQRGIWELDCLILPFAIKEGERPFYPFAMPIFEDTGKLLFFEPIQPQRLTTDIPQKFVEVIKKMNYLPKRLLVGSKEAYDLIQPVASRLKINIYQVDNLPNVEYFVAEIKKALTERVID